MKVEFYNGIITAHIGWWSATVYYPMVSFIRKDFKPRCFCAIIKFETTVAVRNDWYVWAVAIKVAGFGFGVAYKSDYNPAVEAAQQQTTATVCKNKVG